MLTVKLSDQQWQKILLFLRSHPNIYVDKRVSAESFSNQPSGIARSGAKWRLLPADYDNWNTVYKRFARWSAQGVIEQLHQALADDADMEHLLINSNIICAHPSACASRK